MQRLRRSLSCEFTDYPHRREFEHVRPAEPRSFSVRKKSVQWSNDLEEVRYYVPKRSRSESIRRRIRKVKQRAEKITDKPLNSLNETLVKRLYYVRKNGSCSFSLDNGLQSFEEYNKQWDLLFELARQRRGETILPPPP